MYKLKVPIKMKRREYSIDLTTSLFVNMWEMKTNLYSSYDKYSICKNHISNTQAIYPSDITIILVNKHKTGIVTKFNKNNN